MCQTIRSSESQKYTTYMVLRREIDKSWIRLGTVSQNFWEMRITLHDLGLVCCSWSCGYQGRG